MRAVHGADAGGALAGGAGPAPPARRVKWTRHGRRWTGDRGCFWDRDRMLLLLVTWWETGDKAVITPSESKKFYINPPLNSKKKEECRTHSHLTFLKDK